jgi:NAD-dependent dihydropyrimidine dehydrogenase PreA subunit
MGRFVEVAISPDGLDRERASAVVRACPVDIFALEGGSGVLVSAADQEDECILCGRCVALAPGAVSVRRCYGERRAVEAAEVHDA